MNKQQAQEQLNKTKEERFFELIQDLTPFWDKKIYPDSIFYYKGDKLMLEYNQKTGYLWIRYNGFWEVFEYEYGLNYEDAKDFLKGMLEEHFKWREVIAECMP